MEIVFETRRLYVAPRRSVLFFAKVRDHRVRCYVAEDALIETPRALREESDLYQRCLLAFDRHKDSIQAVARRLLEAKGDDLDGALIVSGSALALASDVPPVVEAAKADALT